MNGLSLAVINLAVIPLACCHLPAHIPVQTCPSASKTCLNWRGRPSSRRSDSTTALGSPPIADLSLSLSWARTGWAEGLRRPHRRRVQKEPRFPHPRQQGLVHG
ncbi:hypothetical protein F5Y14DRAFT_352855 [Nemania sp. NC0429]|nr:hypothetical protein F5Y14DRAFT_352855 [Nemania sp. NC0429]